MFPVEELPDLVLCEIKQQRRHPFNRGKYLMNTDTTYIKLIAVVSMVIDHIGAIFFPEIVFFRIIGRIAFPLFAYCVVLGAEYTHDFRRYINRLLLWGVIAQPVYMLALGTSPFRLNVLFTLAFGLKGIAYARRCKNATVVLIMLASTILPVEYGVCGVTFILFVYILWDYLPPIVMLTIMVFVFVFPEGVSAFAISGFNVGLQWFALLAIPFMYIRTRPIKPINKHFFYWFYPLHLLALFLLKALLTLIFAP